ncbi:hypothetical protein K474DRAFT_566633 [Panus rudis PR-1116 ss-1]|nr:hypothetical protein K474DRAFT_566633 [Panus rudis PR-1116 ss-1]
MDQWLQSLPHIFGSLQAHLSRREHLSCDEQARIAFVVASFDREDSWSPAGVLDLGHNILKDYVQPATSVVQRVLLSHVKPIFQTNLHPGLNPTTARKLQKPLGGPLSQQDFYEDQSWKLYPAIFSVLRWCVRQINKEAFNDLWHLIVPPMMILLDDYDVKYKLQGISLASEFLEAVPAELLHRTGVDDLLFSSLKTSMTFLHNPSTPIIIRRAVPTWLTLVELTAAPGSVERFNQLCSLLGESIIGSIWLYASNDPETIEATLDVLPAIVFCLDIGVTRYLKAIIPQLLHLLSPPRDHDIPLRMQKASLQSLNVIVRVSFMRMHRWGGVILDDMARLWIRLTENQNQPGGNQASMKDDILNVVRCLIHACPSYKDQLGTIIQVDPVLFRLWGVLLEGMENL